MKDPEYLARLQESAVTGKLSRDVGAWAVRLIADAMASSDVITLRNRYLHMAADLLPGSVEAKALRLHEEAMAVYRAWTTRERAPDLTSVRGLVTAALQVDTRAPLGVRQLRRILSVRDALLDTEGIEMSTDPLAQ